jgi:hypothetical protein
MSSLPHRRTGTEEGKKSAEYVAGKMREFGLSDVVIEKAPSMCMFPEKYSLEIDGKKIESFFINGTGREKENGLFNVSGTEFVFVGDGLEKDFEGIDVKDKIVVSSVHFLPHNEEDILSFSDKNELYDPDGLMKTQRHKTNMYNPNNWPYNYFYALKKGAKGFVGILEDYADDPYWYNEDYTEIGEALGIPLMSIPGLWISKSSGAKLKEKFNSAKVLKGEMSSEVLYELRDALNVSGRLKGQSDDYILVHSHHDAVFSGAVQDASGTCEMLALAKYFSQVPEEERKHGFIFAATDSHYTDYMGHQGFIKERQKAGDKIIIDLAIEHIAKEVEIGGDGNFMLTGEAEPRIVYVTEVTGLLDTVKQAFKENNLVKTVFMPVPFVKNTGKKEEYIFRPDEVISDAYYFSEAGIPVVSTVSGPLYIFHPSDKEDMVAKDLLVPIGLAFATIASCV